MRGRFYVPGAAALLAGCGTIDQVPLAYVSTVKVGVSAESATAQVPGGKVMIGVEATDAALVPVAIGRTCRPADGTTCDRIEQVRGNNDISPATYLELARSRADAVRGASAAIRRDEQALAAAVAASVAREAEDATAQAKDQLIADLQAEAQTEAARVAAGAVAMVDPAAAQRAADRDARLAATRAERKTLGDTAAALALARRNEAEARTNLAQSYEGFEASQYALKQALDQHPAASGKRQDALSVFGSFNTAASGDAAKAGAGLKLGKSFSTGVAAQLLTEGFKQAAASDAMSACLKTAAALDQANQAAVSAAVEACRTTQRPATL